MKTFILFLFIIISLNVSAKDYLIFAPTHHSRIFSNVKRNFNKTFKYKARRHHNRVNQLYYQYEHSNPKRISVYENLNRRPKNNRFLFIF